MENIENIINKIFCGDCLEIMKEIDSHSIDAIITDPPYGLVSIQKRFGKEGCSPAKYGKDGSFARLSGGFMGKQWDGSGIEYNVDMWKECYRILKPGGYLLSFGGSRTYHRMACAIEDAGFEIRDMIEWIYGSGFPKSLDVGKAVDKLQGNEREWISESPFKASDIAERASEGKCQTGRTTHPDITKGTSKWEGWGTALKPAHEPICMARKPLSEKTVAENVLKYGTGGINIDACRIEHNEPEILTNRQKDMGQSWNSENTGLRNNPTNIASANVNGRFPANLIHDGSDEVLEIFPNVKTGSTGGGTNKFGGMFGSGKPTTSPYREGDSGSASRFFYCAKASKSEREHGCEKLDAKIGGSMMANTGDVMVLGGASLSGNHKQKQLSKNNHPTVKPLSLMKYLIKLVTTENAIVLDPFLGSGTTAIAAKQLNRNYIGIELSEEYCKIAYNRIKSLDIK
jgi:site-specific DNA-methyltransferase (adenine-specific)